MRPLGDRDGGLRLGPRGIDHADHAEQHEIVLDALGDRLVAGVCGSKPKEAADTVRVAIASTRSAWPASSSLRRESSARRSSPSGTSLPSSHT